MNKIALAVALVGIAAAGFGGWQTLQSSSIQADIDLLRTSQQNWAKQSQDQSDQYNKTIASLRQQLQDERHQLELAKARPPEPAPALAVTNANKAPAPPVANTQTKTAASSAQALAAQTLANLTPERRQVLGASLYASQFGGFISTLKLAPEVEAALKQRLIDMATRQLDMSAKIAAGELNTKEASNSTKEETNRILAEYLSREQLAAFSEYQAQAPARSRENLNKMYAMDIQNGLPGLTEQNRALVISLYTEFMSRPAANPAQFLERRNEAADEVVQKLQGKIDDSQLQQVKDYFKYQRRINEAVNPGR